MNNTARKEAETTLAKLVKGMDIPLRRITDVRWLHRNLGVRNSTHERYEQARQHIASMVDNGWY